MNTPADRVRSIGWAVTLGLCLVLFLALAIKVNAVKSQVRLEERRIVALKQQKQMLETEFETRSNQQQLRSLNDVEFGYKAPAVGQYLENERQLADLGKPRAPGAPAPIRVASARDAQEESIFPAMVSPLTGQAMAAEVPAEGRRKPLAKAALGERLSHLDARESARE